MSVDIKEFLLKLQELSDQYGFHYGFNEELPDRIRHYTNEYMNGNVNVLIEMQTDIDDVAEALRIGAENEKLAAKNYWKTKGMT